MQWSNHIPSLPRWQWCNWNRLFAFQSTCASNPQLHRPCKRIRALHTGWLVQLPSLLLVCRKYLSHRLPIVRDLLKQRKLLPTRSQPTERLQTGQPSITDLMEWRSQPQEFPNRPTLQFQTGHSVHRCRPPLLGPLEWIAMGWHLPIRMKEWLLNLIYDHPHSFYRAQWCESCFNEF